MHNFKELQVWQKAIALAAKIYRETEKLPRTEKYNLISQMQRAVTSIPSNVAEGCGRNSKALLTNFLDIAIGSSYELETQIILSSKLGYFNEETTNELLMLTTEVQRMLNGLNSRLRQS
jgi:four helix bundle protein